MKSPRYTGTLFQAAFTSLTHKTDSHGPSRDASRPGRGQPEDPMRMSGCMPHWKCAKAALQNKEIMVDPLHQPTLRAACDAMRAAIAARARGDIEKMRAPLRALVGLEQAAFNAPQN